MLGLIAGGDFLSGTVIFAEAIEALPGVPSDNIEVGGNVITWDLGGVDASQTFLIGAGISPGDSYSVSSGPDASLPDTSLCESDGTVGG